MPKRVTTSSKRAKKTCLSIPSGLGTILEKMIFSAPGTLMDPPLPLNVRGPACPPAPPSDHRYRGPGVSLGDSETWKPQKVGGCGWDRCPRNGVLSHVARDTARSWFWARFAQTAHIRGHFSHFWAISQTYRGVRGQQRALCHRAIKAHVKCSNRFPSFGRFEWVPGPFWAGKAAFGHKMRGFGRAPPALAPPPRGATK